MKYRIFAFCAFLIACFAFDAKAKEGVVKTTDGNTFQGDVKEDADNVIISVKGIVTTLERGRVASIEYTGDLKEEFQQRLDKLDPKDVAGRIELARWAFEKSRYDLAQAALDEALAIDPNSREATDMQQTNSQQIALERKKSAGSGSGPTARPTTSGAANGSDRPRTPGNLLTAEQINQIRQAELRTSDTSVRVRLEGDVQRAYASEIGIPVVQFRQSKILTQALEILDKGSPELHPKVRVLSDPASIATFRREIHPYVLNGCATSGCHGGGNAGSLVLNNPAETDAATYTNFYILATYSQAVKTAEASPFGATSSMINRGSASESILATYGLPADHTDRPHPAAPGFRAVFRDKSDPRYLNLINWIGKSLNPTEPTYDFELTGAAGTTQPAADK